MQEKNNKFANRIFCQERKKNYKWRPRKLPRLRAKKEKEEEEQNQ